MRTKIKKIKFNKISFSRLGLLYIVTMTIAELYQTGLLTWYYLTAILIGFFWGGLGFLKYICNRKDNAWKKSVKQMCLLFMLPWAVFFIYNMIIFSCGIAYKPFMKSSFVQILFVPCIILGAIGSFYLFKRNTLRYFLYSICLQYIIMLTVELFKMGPFEFFYGILGIFTGNSVNNPFEQNSDVVLALGLLLVFYFDIFVRKRTLETNHAFLVLILVLLGGKRIEILAVIAICLEKLFTGILEEKKQNQVQNFISSLLLFTMFIFVYLVISGAFSAFVYSHDINAMGRMKMWDYVAQYASFGPSYFGRGYSFSNLILELNDVLTYKSKVYVLHSDILKIYYDLGFAMFSFWSVYHLFVLPNRCRKKFGYEIGNMAWALMMFLFVLYFTDNAATYFITQTTLVYILLQTIIRKNENVNYDSK